MTYRIVQFYRNVFILFTSKLYLEYILLLWGVLAMNKKQVAFAFGLGLALGYVIKLQTEMFQKMTPEKALKQAKETFKKSGPIHGSWIYMKPEDFEKNGLMYKVYRGGITRLENGENKQYEFYVDADTGTIIHTNEAS